MKLQYNDKTTQKVFVYINLIFLVYIRYGGARLHV